MPPRSHRVAAPSAMVTHRIDMNVRLPARARMVFPLAPSKDLSSVSSLWCDAWHLCTRHFWRREMVDPRVLAERSEIEHEIAGHTICEQLKLTAERFPD